MGQRTPHVKGQPAESPTSPSTSHTGHSSLPHGPWEPTCLLVSGVSGRVGPGPCSEGKKMGTPGTWQQWRGFSGVAGVAPGLELGPSLHVHTSPHLWGLLTLCVSQGQVTGMAPAWAALIHPAGAHTAELYCSPRVGSTDQSHLHTLGRGTQSSPSFRDPTLGPESS